MEASQASEAGSIPVARSTTARPRAGRFCYACAGELHDMKGRHGGDTLCDGFVSYPHPCRHEGRTSPTKPGRADWREKLRTQDVQTWPPTSDITVFFVVPFLVFERACALGWPFSYPKCSESSAARPRSKASLSNAGNNPGLPVISTSPASRRSNNASNAPERRSSSTASRPLAPDTTTSSSFIMHQSFQTKRRIHRQLNTLYSIHL